MILDCKWNCLEYNDVNTASDVHGYGYTHGISMGFPLGMGMGTGTQWIYTATSPYIYVRKTHLYIQDLPKNSVPRLSTVWIILLT